MDKKTLIMGVIALAILMTGCIDEKPNEGVIPTNVTQPQEPVVKDSEEAIDLVKEKHPELGDVEECRFLGDVCNHSINVNEISKGWNLTFWKRSKDCEDQCWVNHYSTFIVYENGTLIKGEEYKEIKLIWGFSPEVEIDVEENESFLIREGQTAKGKIRGYNASIKYVKTDSSRLLRVEDFPYKGELEIVNVTFDCSGEVCKYDLDIYLSCVPLDFCEVMRFEVKPINWAVDNSEVISLHNSPDSPAIYIKIYKWKKWKPVAPEPMGFYIGVGETKNGSIYSIAESIHELQNRTLHNITVNYISASPRQVFEVIFDGERERFEIDLDTTVLSVNGIEKGETCRKHGKWWICEYEWKKGDLFLKVWPESDPLSDERWKTITLAFRFDYW